jgi:hypothetical protein
MLETAQSLKPIRFDMRLLNTNGDTVTNEAEFAHKVVFTETHVVFLNEHGKLKAAYLATRVLQVRSYGE